MIQVYLIDWGVKEWFSDRKKVRQIPDECKKFPSQVTVLRLPLKAIEDIDIVVTLLTECLLTVQVNDNLIQCCMIKSTFKDMEMTVNVSKCDGELVGHLTDEEENLIYQRLIDEKIVAVM